MAWQARLVRRRPHGIALRHHRILQHRWALGLWRDGIDTVWPTQTFHGIKISMLNFMMDSKLGYLVGAPVTSGHKPTSVHVASTISIHPSSYVGSDVETSAVGKSRSIKTPCGQPWKYYINAAHICCVQRRVTDATTKASPAHRLG